MKTYKKILFVLLLLIGANSFSQSDAETIKNLLRFTYFPEPTEDRRFPIVNTSVASGTETGRFWEDSGINDLQNFVRAVLKNPNAGGDASLQHSIAEILRLSNRPILIYLWNDANSLQESQYAHAVKPCISDYDQSGTTPNFHAWPCATNNPADTNWGGNVHMGQYYAADQGFQELKSTFIHEFMHTQDRVDSFYYRYFVDGHAYRYGADDDHYAIEAIPNRRMAYGEGIANTMSLMYDGASLEEFLKWYSGNGPLMVERAMPSNYFRILREQLGVSDDVWLYDQINQDHGPGTPVPWNSGYVTYKIRELNSRFISHNEMILSMAMGVTALHVRDIDPFIYAVREVNSRIAGNQEQDPFALIINEFSKGLTSNGQSLSDALTQLQSEGVNNNPYHFVLPLAYFDFFTGYRTSTKDEFKELFSNQLDESLLNIYWGYFKDRVRSVTIPYEFEISSVLPSVIWEILTDVSIQCGVTQSLSSEYTNFNFESSKSSAVSSTTTEKTSDDSVETTDPLSQADGDCRDWPSFGTESSVTANGVSVPVFNATEAQKSNLEQTLSRLPVAHINAIPRIIIVSDDGPNYFLSHPERGGASWRCSPANRANEWIKISAYSLTERRNQRINFTLLHEIGHFIDRDFNIVSAHQEEARRYLRETDYQGHTQGAGEAIAQGYMYYFASTTATERNPRVRDRLPVYLKEILENSSAWTNDSTW